MTPERRKELEERARSIAREELNAGFSTIGTARAIAPLAQIILRGMEAVDREAEERGRREEREGLAAEIRSEAEAAGLGATFAGGMLHGASVYNVKMWAARRIKGEPR